MSTERWIMHVDLDAFFASVEELLDPSLRDKPIIVGGRPEGRGVVASASYAARAFGVRSAMPVAQALRLCPQAIVVPARHGEYGQRSRRVMAILHEITPAVEQVSVDEAFCDISGCQRLWGEPRCIGELVQRRVREEEGLPVSVGIAANKLVAKIACDEGKPRGLEIVPHGQERAYLAPRPIEVLWGVGRVTGSRLRSLGIDTIGDIVTYGEEGLARILGERHGRALWERAHGRDDSPIASGPRRQSISQERTFAKDVSSRDELQRTILSVSEELAGDLRRRGMVAHTVRIKMRTPDFHTRTRQITLAQPTDQADIVSQAALDLFDEHWGPGQPLRLFGVGVEGLLTNAGYQLDLLDHSDQRQIRLSQTLDDIRNRFGQSAITRAALLDRRGKRRASDHTRTDPPTGKDS